MRFPQVVITCDGKEVTISTESRRKENVAVVGTFQAHAKNMCRGVSEGFEYHMKVVYSHFPIQLKTQGNRSEINNFLGEKKARYARIEEGVKIKIANDEVVLSGIDRELVGTTAATSNMQPTSVTVTPVSSRTAYILCRGAEENDHRNKAINPGAH